jgi:PAS domain S-box-containing protein
VTGLNVAAEGMINALDSQVCLVDEEGRIVAVNRAWMDFAGENGYSGAAPFEGTNYLSVCHSAVGACSEATPAAEGIRAVIRGELPRFTLEYPCDSPSRRRWFEATVTPFQGNGRPGAVIVHVEITSRKAAQRALEESEKRFRALVETVPNIAVQGYDPQRRVVFWNAASERLYGYAREEALGRYLEDLIIPAEMRDGVVAAVNAWVKDGLAIPAGELVLRRKDGSPVPVFSSHVMLVSSRGEREMHCIDVDLTSLKRMERGLVESEAHYRLLFEANPLPMWVIDEESLGFLQVNEAAVQHYGYSRAEFLGMTLKDIRPAEDVPAFEKAARETKPGIRNPGIWRHRRKDGSIIEVEITTHDIVFGGRQGRLVLAKDVTEQKRVEAEIRRLNVDLEERVRDRTARLEEANRELEAFSYTVSHDLRAPLRAIEGFSAMVIRDSGDRLDPEARSRLEVVRANVLRMAHLIDDLLALSRTSRAVLQRVPLKMRDLAESAFAEVTTESGTLAKTVFRVGELPDVEGDESLLRQVWVNLLSNAVKYSARKEKPVIEVEGAVEGAFAVFHVRDNGAGFDMAYAHKLYGVFQRLHGATEFEGTGIGLAIVQRIVVRHGGRVWGEGAVGQGARFFFAVPATGAAPNASRGPSAPEPGRA